MTPEQMALRKEILRAREHLLRQMAEIERDAKRMGTEPYILRDGNGNWPMAALVVAEVQILHSLTLLSTKEK